MTQTGDVDAVEVRLRWCPVNVVAVVAADLNERVAST